MGERLLLGLERLLQRERFALEHADEPDRGEMQGGGKGVVGGLVDAATLEVAAFLGTSRLLVKVDAENLTIS